MMICNGGSMKKKIWKLIGNIVAIIAVIFVIKRFIGMDIDFHLFMSPLMIISLILAVAVQTFTLCVGCFPWLKFVEIFSGKKIPFKSAMAVYTKSNIYKYVPGNVFQYVGRNKLAADMEISNVDVACSTVLDVLCGIIPTAIISVIMLGNYVLKIMKDYWKNALIILIIGVCVLILLAVLIFVFRKKLANYLSRYRSAFSKQNRKKLLPALGYYVGISTLSALINFFTAYLVFDKTVPLGSLFTITGAYLFSFILGYITPGAPGGIGIRESVMLLVCNGMYEETVIIYVLLYRLSSIITDIIGLVIGIVAERRYINVESKGGL